MTELAYEKLTIYEVEEFYKFLLEKVKNTKSKLELDFSAIKKIDMVVIQLLLSLQETCKKKLISLTLKNFSSQLMDTLESSGCHMILEIKNDK